MAPLAKYYLMMITSERLEKSISHTVVESRYLTNKASPTLNQQIIDTTQVNVIL
jgi:hypothetical protein